MKFYKMTMRLGGKERNIMAGFRFPDGTTVSLGNSMAAGPVISSAEEFDASAKALTERFGMTVEWFE